MYAALLARNARRNREHRARNQERGTFCLTDGCLTRTTEGYCGKHQRR